MVIAQLLGGLGNQMFQYAAARSLALRNGGCLSLDADAFLTYHLHNFELTRVFGCQSNSATDSDFKKVLGWRSLPYVRKMLSYTQFASLRGEAYVVEPHFQYWQGIASVPDDCYLVGYWQSEKYFKEYESAIRKDFEFKEPLDDINAELANHIRHCSSVSLHIRRGDYVANATTNHVHGTCSLDYYQRAIAMISEKEPSPEFFVFSDDIAWVKEHLHLEFPVTYIAHNSGEDSYRDMQLMSLCQHNIIANSSFSWWGAWLNEHEDKIVIAPKQWFAIDRETEDLIPEQWVRL